jgi:hypothetical protein
MSEPLRPLTLGEILDRTAQLYRGNFASFAGIAAVPTAILLLVMIPAVVLIGVLGVAAKGNAALGGGLVALLVVVGIIAGVVALAATVISQAALVRAAIGAHTGQKLKIREALDSVRPRFWRYLGLMCLQGIFVVLIPAVIAGVSIGAVFLLVRAAGGGVGLNAAAGFATFLISVAAVVIIILRALGYSLAMPACIAEGKSAWESLQRSNKLSKGARGRIFLMLLLVWALSMVVTMIGYIPLMAITAAAAVMGKGAVTATIVMVIAQVVNVLVNFALQTLITPVYMTALVLFYYDQRVRTEGYDIEWMMQQAGLTGDQNAQSLPQIVALPSPDPGTLNG